jgi:rhodanese-related sulfurtransferase
MNNLDQNIENAKQSLPNVTPTPPDLKSQVSAQELKARLEWGEPGLTIIDVRDRNAFNDAHIMGAIPMPSETLVDQISGNLEPQRDIYVYGDTDQQTAEAAQKLRGAGFIRVAELKGGLSDWKAIAGSTEGILEAQSPVGAEGYNVVSQLQNSAEAKQRADAQKNHR